MLSGSGGFGVRFSFYALIQVFTAMTLWLLLRLLRRDKLLRPQAPTAASGDPRLPTLAAVFLVSIPLAFVTQWAYALWAAAPLIMNGVRRVQAWRQRSREVA